MMLHSPACKRSVQRLFPRTSARVWRGAMVVAALLAVAQSSPTPQAPAEEKASAAIAAEARLLDSVRYLASDELEGRGIGVKGLDLAADYLAEQFRQIGLRTDLIDGGPFQKFNMTLGAELGESNQVTLVGPATADGAPGARLELKLDADFSPLALGGSGQLDFPLVFAGYGITAKDEGYDDYAGLDVEGKAVIVLRHEPQQNNPHSAFNGTQHSQYAPFVRKLSNAYEHGAAAVIFCTDDYEIRDKVAQRRKRWMESLDELTALEAKFREIKSPSVEQLAAHKSAVEKLLDAIRDQGEKMAAEFDPVLGFRSGGPGGDQSRMPAIHCRRSVLDAAIKAALGTTLAELEAKIDEEPAPQSRELTGWRLTGEISVRRQETEVKNVLAVLPGEGPRAEETIVIGAHYDHLGFGGEGSLAPGAKEIHNGADDNGSGTAALLEVARRLASLGHPLPRRVLFIAFTGEERGLVGSDYYCKHPLFPLDQTVSMLNMDMVGRLDGEKLIIQGVDTAPEFGPIIDRLNEALGFKITRQSGGLGPSDHASFYLHKAPVMHFFTGTHSDYHRPSDDYDKLNVDGMRRVSELVADTALALAEAETRPTYVEVKSSQAGGGGDRPYFGSIPDFAQDQPGYAISGVAKESPSEKAGLQKGDIIVKLGESRIGNLEDFDSALRKHKAGDKVAVIVKRGEKEVTLEVVLEAPR